MREISYEEFKELNGNPMAGVAEPEVKYFASDSSDELGVVAKTKRDRYQAIIVRYSSIFDQKRSDELKSFNRHKDWEDAEEWLENEIG